MSILWPAPVHLLPAGQHCGGPPPFKPWNGRTKAVLSHRSHPPHLLHGHQWRGKLPRDWGNAWNWHQGNIYLGIDCFHTIMTAILKHYFSFKKGWGDHLVYGRPEPCRSVSAASRVRVRRLHLPQGELRRVRRREGWLHLHRVECRRERTNVR